MTASSSNLEVIFHRLIAGATGKAVAEAVGTDDTHIAKFRSGERGMRIDQIGPLLEAVGLKAVPVNEVTVDQDYLDALETMSRRGIGRRDR